LRCSAVTAFASVFVYQTQKFGLLRIGNLIAVGVATVVGGCVGANLLICFLAGSRQHK